jgi:glycosyltransferase involved in cell wall biosynthesis
MRVVSAIMFFPRGGSSHAARALSRGLRRHGIDVTQVAGSLPTAGPHADAVRFYGEQVLPVDFSAAVASGEPMRYDDAPLHPSYEDRPGAPDRVFASLDDLEYERQVRAWCDALQRADAPHADVLHLHHLTPINEAAARVAPQVPVVGHLHGTELLMLEKIAAGAEWPYAERWATRLRTWARHCARLLVVPAGIERARKLLGVTQLVALPNGVDIELFDRQDVERTAFWGGTDVDPGATILLYVGRFTAVKRLDRLIEAYARAREQTASKAALVLVGGHLDEVEGEHPAALAQRLGAPDVHLAGWHDQSELPAFFSAADAVVTASEREQFGQVLVEGMACGLPAIAPRRLGPASIIAEGETGWLVAPDDVNAFAHTLVAVFDNPAERRRRGTRARSVAREQFSWDGIATQLIDIFSEVTGSARQAPALGA